MFGLWLSSLGLDARGQYLYVKSGGLVVYRNEFVSGDQKREAWVNAIAQLKMPWLQLSDLKGWQCAAAPVYKIDAIPDNILIDPHGKIADRALRGKALQHRLQSIFGE